MKKTTKFPDKVKGIMQEAIEKNLTPFQSISSFFNPKTNLYEVTMR